MTPVSILEPMPAPSSERRDDIGRLVAVTWHGSAVSGNKRWLVAVDGSECSLRAVAMAARLSALGRDGEIDIVHVQPWLVKEAAETELARRGWAATTQARELLDSASVGWHLYVVMGEAATQIVGLADAPDFDGIKGIVIGSRGQSVVKALMLGSVAEEIVHQAKLPVMIVR